LSNNVFLFIDYHLPPFNAGVKNARNYTSSPPYIFMAWYLIKHRIRLHGMTLSKAQGQLLSYLTIALLASCKSLPILSYVLTQPISYSPKYHKQWYKVCNARNC